jgi:iron(II)-dependent oxidoreductase
MKTIQLEMAVLLGGGLILVSLSGVWAEEPPTLGEGREVAGEADQLSRLKTPDEVALIPAGWFPMGSTSRENRGGYMTEQPQHRVYLDDYEIDRYEVSNARYLRFILETGHAPPAHWTGITFPQTIANHPVIGVSWFDADAFCRNAGKRLPTEAEWEKAASGGRGLNYPWGTKPPNPELANLGRQMANANVDIEAVKGRLYPPLADVNAYAVGQSPYGVFQMGGNVMEWVSDWWSPEYYRESPERNPQGPAKGAHKVIRGGSWNDDPLALRTATRSGMDPKARTLTIGFRCIREMRSSP